MTRKPRVRDIQVTPHCSSLSLENLVMRAAKHSDGRRRRQKLGLHDQPKKFENRDRRSSSVAQMEDGSESPVFFALRPRPLPIPTHLSPCYYNRAWFVSVWRESHDVRARRELSGGYWFCFLGGVKWQEIVFKRKLVQKKVLSWNSGREKAVNSFSGGGPFLIRILMKRQLYENINQNLSNSNGPFLWFGAQKWAG